MTATQIGELVGAGVAVLVALSGWLKAHSAQKVAKAALKRAVGPMRPMSGIDQ